MQGNLTAGEFMGFITALLAVYQPLRSVATVQTWFCKKGWLQAKRVFAILDARDAITDDDNAQDPAGQMPVPCILTMCPFQYEGREHPALNSVSIEVKPGQSVALVGASGRANQPCSI